MRYPPIKKQTEKKLSQKAEFFLQCCEQNIQFAEVLMTIYLQSDSTLHRRQALNCLKSLVNKVWVKKKAIFNETATPVDIENMKTYLRKSIIEALNHEFDLKFRKVLNSIFSLIVYNNINNSLDDLLRLSNFWFSDFEKLITEGQNLINEFTLQKLKTIRFCLKVVSQKKTIRNLAPHQELVFILYQNLTNFIVFVDQIFEKTKIGSDVLLLKIIKELYLSAIFLICCGNNSFNSNSRICQMIAFLLSRNKAYVNLYFLSQNTKFDDIFTTAFEKHCVNIIFEYSQIVIVSPLSFHSCVNDYLEYALSCFNIHWKATNLQKAVAIQMYRILKCYMFYTDPHLLSEKKLNEKMKISTEYHEICHKAFILKINNSTTIQTLVQNIMSEYFSHKKGEDDEHSNATEDEIEMFLEDEEKVGIDILVNEFDASCARIGSSIFEQVLLRFPTIGLEIYQNLLNEIMSERFLPSDKLADEIFAQIVYLNRVYEFYNIPESHRLNLFVVFSFLFKKGTNNIVYNRRALIVLKQLILEKKVNEFENIFSILTNLLQVDDYIVQFEVLHCLFLLLKNNEAYVIDYRLLVKNIIPVFIKIIRKFSNHNLIFKIGQQFCNLLERAETQIGFLIRF